jgi:hypothetical protein
MAFSDKWPVRYPSLYERYNITPDEAKDLSTKIYYLRSVEKKSFARIALQLDVPEPLVKLLWRRMK